MKAITTRWQHVLKDKRKKKNNNTQQKEDERIKTNRLNKKSQSKHRIWSLFWDQFYII